MATRGKTEQSEHDLVVEASAATFGKTGGSASTNPSSEKMLKSLVYIQM